MVRRQLIVCCDGTANDGINNSAPLTNVSRIARCIAPTFKASRENSLEETAQIVYYRSGVGTGTSSRSNVVDWIWGRGIHHNIREAYTFVCLNYTSSGDGIVLVGFSRGAFAARAVASLISDVGVLKKAGLPFLNDIYDAWRMQHCAGPFAAAMVTAAKALGFKSAPTSLDELRRKLTTTGKLFGDVSIKACAVWDTVAALPSSELSFVNETIAPKIELALHALALNEERGHFTPLLWKKPTSATQKLQQCWFLGTHSGVGGGSGNLELGNISLAWMIAQLDGVVAFDTAAVYDITRGRLPHSNSHDQSHLSLEVRQGEGSHTYGFALQAPIDTFQAGTDIQVGWFEWFFRSTSWRYRTPFASGFENNESIHWSVPTLIKTQIIRHCVPYQSLTEDLQSRLARREVFEGIILQAWIIRECLSLIALLIRLGGKHLPSDVIPIYPVLWEPRGWAVEGSQFKQYPWALTTKTYERHELSIQVNGKIEFIDPDNVCEEEAFGVSGIIAVNKGRLKRWWRWWWGRSSTLKGHILVNLGDEGLVEASSTLPSERQPREMVDLTDSG